MTTIDTADALKRLVSVLDADAPVCDIIDAAARLQWNNVGVGGFDAVRQVLTSYLATSRNTPLVMLALPTVLQAELVLFSHKRFPGIDRTTFLKATPRQVVRRLSGRHEDKAVDEQLIARYNFSLFQKDDWKEYFSVCATPIAAARTFLCKDSTAGGFTDDEITALALRNPGLVDCIPSARISPNTAVALLISGRADSLWGTYDFTRLQKAHWRELFLHTNPRELPAACKSYVENKDGAGFTPEELLQFAHTCHALINSLDPNKVPFSLAYELYQTGRADVLWANYPFAQLDKMEWRKILTNPNVKIPKMFIEVVKSNRFKMEELCSMALTNERLLPFLVAADIPAENVVDILLKADAEYLWDYYHFSRFGPDHWKRLVLGLSSVIRPRAMSAFSTCKGITPDLATLFIRKDTAYCPYIPVASIPPEIAVEVLVHGKGHFLWNKYDFTRLSNDQWLTLLESIDGEPPLVVQQFLRNQLFIPEHERVDSGKLNALLIRHENLVQYVSEQLIDPRVAHVLISKSAQHELWNRFDFARFTAVQLVDLLRTTVRRGAWPEALKKCFSKENAPLRFEDVLSIAEANPAVVLELISLDWIEKVDDLTFEWLVASVGKSPAGVAELSRRMHPGEGSWCSLPISKLKSILSVVPDLRKYVEWKKWPYGIITKLAKAQSVFESEVPHPKAYFVWKHMKSLAAMLALTVAAFCLVSHQSNQLAANEKQRQHWNIIVNTIHALDDNKCYDELSTNLSRIAAVDMSVISNDVFIKNATAHLARWKKENESAMRSIDRLRVIRDGGWRNANPSEVSNLVASVENCEYARHDIQESCASMKMSWKQHLDEVEYRKHCAHLSDALNEIKSRIPIEGTIAVLERLDRTIADAKNYVELSEMATCVGSLLTNRIDVLRREAMAKSLAVVSNGVERIFETMCKRGGFDLAHGLPEKRKGLMEEPCYETYCQTHEGKFEEMTAAIALFQELKIDCDEKAQEAKRLDERFKKEFLTSEAGAACSNLVTGCTKGLKKANRFGSWKDPILAYTSIKQRAEDILARDLRCWKLVDELNGATTYDQYLNAKNSLVKEFGDVEQLSHLGSIKTVSASDAAAYYKDSYKTYWGGKAKYRYHFVGVVQLDPEDVHSVLINVNNKKQVSRMADLYTLMRGRGLAQPSKDLVRSERLIRQEGNKYYRLTGVDYTGCQGVPLFVRSEHFTGRE